MELSELLPPGTAVDDDLVAWARRRADELLQGQAPEAVLAELGAAGSMLPAARPMGSVPPAAPRARAMTPPPLPPSSGGGAAAPRARAMTPMPPPPPPRERAMTPVPPPPPSLAVGMDDADAPPLERAATTLDMDVAAAPTGPATATSNVEDLQDVDDVELLEVDADELEMLDDDEGSEEDASGTDASPSARLDGAASDDVPNLFDDADVSPDAPLPDDQKTSISLAPHLREASGPSASAEVREDTSRFALPEDEDLQATDASPFEASGGPVVVAAVDEGSAHGLPGHGEDEGIESGILDASSTPLVDDARANTSTTADMVLDDVDPSSFGLGFESDDGSRGASSQEPVRTGGTQRLTSVDAVIDDGLDDEDDDIDIDMD